MLKRKRTEKRGKKDLPRKEEDICSHFSVALSSLPFDGIQFASNGKRPFFNAAHSTIQGRANHLELRRQKYCKDSDRGDSISV